MKARAKQLRLVAPGTRAAVRRHSGEAASLRLDLARYARGSGPCRSGAFSDKALLAGFSEVEIVHGRGTGALRREVHEFLRSFPAVEHFATAPEDRGGDGMTVVNFR